MEYTFLSIILMEITTSSEGLPLSLLIPVVVALSSVIVYLYCERKKDQNKISELEKEFRKKINETDRAALEAIMTSTESYRKELVSVIKAAYNNNTKVAEILTALNIKSDRTLSEIETLNITYNNLYLKLHTDEEGDE